MKGIPPAYSTRDTSLCRLALSVLRILVKPCLQQLVDSKNRITRQLIRSYLVDRMAAPRQTHSNFAFRTAGEPWREIAFDLQSLP